MVWLYLLWLIIAFAVLAEAGSYLVKSLTKLAIFFRVSEFVLASILMAAATSLPELFVGIIASLSKTPAIILGNVIGANILNLTLVMGIPILLAKGIKIKSKLVKEDSFYMILTVLLVFFLMLDKVLSRFDGIILLAVFLLYFIKTLKHRKMFEKVVNHMNGLQLFNNTVIFFISLIALIVSAKFVVKYAVLISEALQFPPILIGLFLVSAGTTLPELTFGIFSVLKKHESMSLGNVFGSVIFNSTLILGVGALINPITSDFILFLVSAVFLIVLAFIFWTFLESDKKLSWQEGVALLLLYFFFIIVELTIKGII